MNNIVPKNTAGRPFPLTTILIIVINAAIYLWLNHRPDFEYVIIQHGFIPSQFEFTDVFTSLFLHEDFFHLAFNMWFLWIFGDNIEEKLGPFLFGIFYLLGGAFANVLYWTTHPDPFLTIGASGAISAVLGSYLIFCPDTKISFLALPVPSLERFEMDAFNYFGVWFIGQFIMFLFGGQEVNYVVHLSGFIFGIFCAAVINYLKERGNSSETRRKPS